MPHTYNTWNEKQNNYMAINVIIAKKQKTLHSFKNFILHAHFAYKSNELLHNYSHTKTLKFVYF
jgi:hypothetical protein